MELEYEVVLASGLVMALFFSLQSIVFSLKIADKPLLSLQFPQALAWGFCN